MTKVYGISHMELSHMKGNVQVLKTFVVKQNERSFGLIEEKTIKMSITYLIYLSY